MKPAPDRLPEQTTDWTPAPGTGNRTTQAEEIAETGVYGDAARAAAATARAAVEPPSAFGRYAVRAFLGRGGFGTVYVGHDAELDRKVAIKVPHGLAAEDARPFILSEARRLAQLRHPGILAIHDIGVQDGHVYIVTDFLEGTSLRDRLREGPMPVERTAEIVARVADALMHAHAQRIIHRDVKPANIMLTGDAEPVLLDFGLGLSGAEALTPDNRVLGTPGFMSPEQAQGLGHRIDGRTDIFSLGVVLYRMLCGRLPFAGDTVAETLRQIIEDDPQPPRQLVTNLSAALERVCLKALAKRIEDRYTTARDFADALRDAVRSGTTAPASGTASTLLSEMATKTHAQPRAAAEPQRRRLTLLACSCEAQDVAQPLDLLDPEDQHNIQQIFHRYCKEQAELFGGTLLPPTGREVLICFGYPTAHEDAAVRAMRAGLALLGELSRLNDELIASGVRLSLWAAVHTGQAVVGDGDLSRGEIAIVGEARNVATRLEALSELDALTITEATHYLTRGFFKCESRGKHAVKGVAGRLELFRVLGETGARNRVETEGEAGLTPLVGRDTELAILRDRWEQAADGMGQVVLLIGEAGLGKSRLVHELKTHVVQSSQAGALSLIEWRCSPQHANSSLNPAKDFLSRLLHFGHDDLPERRMQSLIAHLEGLGLGDPITVALFAGLLGLPANDRYPAPNLSPQALRDKTREVLLNWLDACVQRHPVLFVVEDLHWIDPSSLDFLSAHIDRGFRERVLTVLTFRPEFVTPWASKAHQTQIALNRLSKRQTADLMRRKTGRAQLPQSVIDAVAARTDGVPLFVEEFTKVLMETPAAQAAEGDSVLSAVLKGQEIPATLEDLLAARLDHLTSNREVIEMAATLGREFAYDVLRAACSLNEPALQAELAKLVQAELLFLKSPPPRANYLFKHALLQDAAYQSMLKKKRQECHKKIADVLASGFPETEPELLAHHYSEAGLVAQSIPYWLKAGLHAQTTFANTEAIRHLRRGLELLATLEPGPARDEQELSFQVPLGVALFTERGYAAPEVGSIFERARELCHKVGGPARLFYILWGIWAWRIVRSELDICRDLGREMLDLAGADPGFRAEAHYLPEVNALYAGAYETAREEGERVLALQTVEGCRLHSQGTGQNSVVTARDYLAMAYWGLGHIDRGLAMVRESIALGKELAHPFTLSFAYHHSAVVLLNARLWEEALSVTESALTLAQEQGFHFWYSSATLHRGVCLSQLGRSDEGLALMHKGLDGFKASGAAIMVPYYHAFLGRVYLQRGQHDLALQNIEESFAWAYRFGQLWHEAETHRLKGEVLRTTSGSDADVEACFQKALAVARQQHARSFELRAALSLAHLWRKQGKHTDARAALEAIYSWFTEGFDTPDLQDANAFLNG